MTRHTCSKTDRRAYWNYVRFSLAAQCSPMSARHWMLLTQSSVDFAVKKWAAKEKAVLRARVCFDSASDHDRPWAKKARTPRPDSVMLAHIGELNKQGARPGWVIGELRDGLVYPERRVRSQTRPKGGRLLQRFCRSCQTLLCGDQFSCNGKPAGRAICKSCDNTQRIERRKLSKTAGRRTIELQRAGAENPKPRAFVDCHPQCYSAFSI